MGCMLYDANYQRLPRKKRSGGEKQLAVRESKHVMLFVNCIEEQVFLTGGGEACRDSFFPQTVWEYDMNVYVLFYFSQHVVFLGF